MAIQHRRGIYDRFDPSRLVAGEWAIVLSGDTSASDGRAAYICFAAGTVKRIATYEDMAESIANANEELIEELTAQITAATTAANTAASNANTKATAANTAASSANTAASAANTAASNANSKATAANTAASSANSAASSATTAAGRANTAADAANAAATSATEAAESVSDAAYRAETAATSANTAAEAVNSAKDAANAAATAANTAADSANAATSEANAAIEAMGDISELAVPEMTANVRGGAKVGGSTQVVGEKLEIKLSESATGTSVTTGSTSALRELQVHGRSVQDGTPAPDAPVPVQVVQGVNLLDVDSSAVTSGKFIMSDGSLTNSASWNVSGYIPVSDSDYVLHGAGTGSAVSYALYDGSYGLLSAVSYGNRATVPISATGASYLRVCFNTANKETAQLEKGSTPTPYVPYGYMGVKVVYDTKRIRGWAGSDGILHFGNSESMAARVCKGQAITVYGTGNRYFISLFSDEPTTERQKSLWTIAPYGSSAQSEPRTYTVEIDHDGWLFAYINASESSTVRDGSSFFAMREIDLQGNVLASLPDGTRDELHVDSAGHVWIDSNVDKIIFDGTENWVAHSSASNVYYIDQPQLIGAATASQTGYALSNRYLLIQTSSAANMQNNTFFINASSRLFVRNDAITTLENFKADLASNGMIVFGKLATPQTIDLGYIDPPAIPSGSVVTISASLTPTFDLECWTEHASELADIPDAITTPSIVGGSTQVVGGKLEVKLSESATGTSITTGSTSALRELQVHGRSVQDGTPTPDAPVPVQVVKGRNLLQNTATSQTVNGVTFTVNPDGTISLAGTATANTALILCQQGVSGIDLSHLKGKTVTLSGGVSSAIRILFYVDSAPAFGDSGNGVTFTINDVVNTGSTATTTRCYVYINSGTVCENVEIKPQLEAGTEATPYVPYGSIGILIGDTVTSIDLQGNVLASLPDGTRDELHVDSAGHVWIDKRVGYVSADTLSSHVVAANIFTNFVRIRGARALADNPAPYNTPALMRNGYCNVAPFTGAGYNSDTLHAYAHLLDFYLFAPVGDKSTWDATTAADWVTEHGAYAYYTPAATTTIDLGYIDPPAIPSGSVVTVSASLNPTFDIDCWTEHASELADTTAELANEISSLRAQIAALATI